MTCVCIVYVLNFTDPLENASNTNSLDGSSQTNSTDKDDSYVKIILLLLAKGTGIFAVGNGVATAAAPNTATPVIAAVSGLASISFTYLSNHID